MRRSRASGKPHDLGQLAPRARAARRPSRAPWRGAGPVVRDLSGGRSSASPRHQRHLNPLTCDFVMTQASGGASSVTQGRVMG